MARIRLFLKEGKTLANGEHPIMLMVAFNGKCTRSTRYSCPSRYWDKKNECVRKGFSNFSIINYEITRMKNECIERRTEYERLQKPYTAKMLLQPRKDLCAVSNDLKSLIARYIDEKGLEAKTIEKWWVVYRSVCEYAKSKDIVLNEINEAFCRKYCRWLEDKDFKSGSIKSYMSKVVALLHYGVALKLIDEYPLSNWKYHKDYRESKSELYIHSRTMEIMMEMFLDEVIDRNENGMWSYKDGVIEQLMDIHSELYSHYLYLITYWMCGIAPVDVSMLKKTDIKVVMVKDKNYYAIDGNRSKTGMPYRIRIPQNCVESNVLIRTMLMFHQGEYFLPTLEGYKGKDVRKRVNNLYTYHGDNLVNWFQRINEEIARRNVMDNDNIDLIDLECRYYSARHSYIMAQIQKPNVNLLKIATATGKSVSTIHQYISLLGDLDLVD